MTAALRGLSVKADLRTWVSLTRLWLQPQSQVDWGWESSRDNTQSCKRFGLQVSSDKPLLNLRSNFPLQRSQRTGPLLGGLKSAFEIKVTFVFHLEITVTEFGGGKRDGTESKFSKSSLKFPQLVMIRCAIPSTGLTQLFFYQVHLPD